MIKELRAEFEGEKSAKKFLARQLMALEAEGTSVASESGEGSSQGYYAQSKSAPQRLHAKDIGP